MEDSQCATNVIEVTILPNHTSTHTLFPTTNDFSSPFARPSVCVHASNCLSMCVYVLARPRNQRQVRRKLVSIKILTPPKYTLTIIVYVCLCVNGKLLNFLAVSDRLSVCVCMCCSSVVSLDRARDPMHARALSRFRTFLHFTTITIATTTRKKRSGASSAFPPFLCLTLHNIYYINVYTPWGRTRSRSLFLSLALVPKTIPSSVHPHPPMPEPPREAEKGELPPFPPTARRTNGKRKRKR